MAPELGAIEKNQIEESAFGGRFFFPGALGSFRDETLLNRVGGDPNITHLAINEGFDPLKIREKTAFGDGGDVCANAVALLRFTTAPNDAALHWTFTGEFTDSSHKIKV